LSLTLSVRRLVPLCSGGHHKYKRVVGLKTGDPASLYRLDGLTFLQGGEALQGGMNLYRSLPQRQMFAQSGGAAVGASDERILAWPFKKWKASFPVRQSNARLSAWSWRQSGGTL